MAFSIECVISIFVCSAAIIQTCMVIGACWTLISVTKDLKEELDTINRISKDDENKCELHERFIGLIEFHSTAKQFSSKQKSDFVSF